MGRIQLSPRQRVKLLAGLCEAPPTPSDIARLGEAGNKVKEKLNLHRDRRLRLRGAAGNRDFGGDSGLIFGPLSQGINCSRKALTGKNRPIPAALRGWSARATCASGMR